MTPKPIIHGFDHAKGGADPVPGIGDGIQFGGVDPVYGPENVGEWLQIEVTSQGGTINSGVDAYTGLGFGFRDSFGGGIVFASPTGTGMINLDAGDRALGGANGAIKLTAIDGLFTLSDDPTTPGDGTGTFTAGFGTGFNFQGGFVEFANAGFEIDSTAGVDINNTSADGISIDQTGGNSAGHDVTVHADHKVVITSGNDTNITASNTALLRGVASVTVLTDDSPIILEALGGVTEASIQARVSSGNYFWVGDLDPSTEILRITSTGSGNPGKIRMANMGTVNPGISGQLWNNGGVVNIA